MVEKWKGLLNIHTKEDMFEQTLRQLSMQKRAAVIKQRQKFHFSLHFTFVVFLKGETLCKMGWKDCHIDKVIVN